MELRQSRRLSAVPLLLLGALLSPPVFGDCGPGLWHLGAEFFAGGDRSIATVAVFRPGAPPPAPDLAVQPRELAARVAAAGTILDFERYVAGGKVYYALVYDTVKADELLVTGLDAEEVVAQIAANPGKRLLDFEAFAENGKWRYDALFRQGAEERFFAAAVPAAEVGDRLAGRHLVDFEVQGRGPGAPSFALLLGSGPRDQLFFPALGAEDFHKLSHDHSSGYRLEDVEVWTSHLGETRYSALFEKARGADHLFVLACGDEPCGSKSFAEDTAKDLQWQVDHRGPSLRLADLELPLGASGLPLAAAPPAAPAGKMAAPPPKKKPRAKNPRPAADLPLVAPSGQCHHAGLLHDAGTDGPP